MKTARRVVKEEVFPLKNHRKILAAVASIAAIASLTACGGVKDANTASGSAITIGTTDKITSVDPAGSYDNGSYAVQIQISVPVCTGLQYVRIEPGYRRR